MRRAVGCGPWGIELSREVRGDGVVDATDARIAVVRMEAIGDGSMAERKVETNSRRCHELQQTTGKARGIW
jgi:hypothetical protein